LLGSVRQDYIEAWLKNNLLKTRIVGSDTKYHDVVILRKSPLKYTAPIVKRKSRLKANLSKEPISGFSLTLLQSAETVVGFSR
jgi:hypothetical protein